MFNLLNVISLAPDTPDGDADGDGAVDALLALLGEAGPALPGVTTARAGRTLPHALFGGELMWRLSFASEADYRACRASAAWRETIAPALSADRGLFIDSVAYRPRRSVSSQRRGEGVWRCLVIAIDPAASRDTIHAFERDMLLMPDHVWTIRSWQFSDVLEASGRRRWTHVWEQEFDDIGGLHGEYMLSPIHWGLVDGWYDPESPRRIADIACIIHAAIAIDGALIG